jgi:RND family efflux transporter MFP subunit
LGSIFVHRPAGEGMNSGTKRLAAIGIVAVVAAGIAAYFLLRGPSGAPPAAQQRADQRTDTTRPDSARPQRGQQRRRAVANRVVVVKVQVQTIGDLVAAIGTGRAIRSLTISAEVAGVIEDIRFRPGEAVKAGQELLKLKSEAEEIAVKLAQVKVDEADTNLKRLQGLVERNAVPLIQVDQARTAVALARAELEAKQYELKRRVVRAPFDGVMGLTTLGKGDYLAQGAAVATIDDRSSLLIAFVVSERVAGAFTLGHDVRATTPALSGAVFRGKITALDTRVDAASRTLRVEATIPNDQNRLIAGMTFSVQVQIPGEKLPVLPGIAIQWDRAGAFVWALDEGSKVKRVGVTIRRRENDTVAVEAALKDGDQVVIEGTQGLRDGASVTVVQN